jgi:hypothetical protein
MSQEPTVTTPTSAQLEQALRLLRLHGGLPVRTESGAAPRLELTDSGRSEMVCDAGISNALLERQLAYADHLNGTYTLEYPKRQLQP